LREYEGMLILPADADEALVSTAVDRIAKAVEPSGGSVTEIDRWGRRRFAYEIDRQHEGYYVVVRFTGDPSTQPELERVLNIADEVVRHKILVAPPKPPPKADERSRSREGARTERAASPAPA
jgi:small subunit ribosomal protein S6